MPHASPDGHNCYALAPLEVDYSTDSRSFQEIAL